MTLLTWEEMKLAGHANTPVAVTVGVFDGLHRGHQSLLDAITSQDGMAPVVVTFATHPGKVLGRGVFPGFLTTREAKLELLAERGVEIAVEIEFNREFSAMRGAEFLDTLAKSFELRRAVIGHDFRCGSDSLDGAGVASYLAPTEVVLVPALKLNGEIVSSTRVRDLIRDGELVRAKELLGWPYALDLADSVPDIVGGEIRYRTSPLGTTTVSEQVLPPPGRYPATIVDGGSQRHTILTVKTNSMTLPLADSGRIRYIVLQENGLMEQGD